MAEIKPCISTDEQGDLNKIQNDNLLLLVIVSQIDRTGSLL